MTKLTPRWYQQEACDAIIDALSVAANVHPIAAIVTGGGKALLAAMLMQHLNLQWPGSRVLVLAPSMELVKQNVDEAVNYLPSSLSTRVGVYCAGLGLRNRLSQFTIGSPQSVARQVKRFGHIDFVVVDEAHAFDVSNKTGATIVTELSKINPQIRFIGLTATPFRMKGTKVVPLTDCGLFNSLVCDLTSGRHFNRLTREGHIVPVVAPSIRFPQIDTEGVKTRGEDFDEVELAKRAMAVTKACVGVALDSAQDRRHFMWFGVNISHAKMIHEALIEVGQTAVIIHGELDKNERVSGVEDYLSKEYRHIVSVAMLTTGFNAKFVDAVVLLRPTKSLVLFRQMVGRGLRPYPGKEGVLILDAGGNFSRHGAINAEIGQGDSRVNLWECTDAQIETPYSNPVNGKGLRPIRERSAIKFPVEREAEIPDLRIALGLMDPSTPACGFLNDAEHMSCRNCGRPRQGFLSARVERESAPRGLSDDTYDIHDEDSVVLRDSECTLSEALPVHDMTLKAEGNSILSFAFDTDAGEYSLRLDFDRGAVDNKFYAQARKFFEAATGRRVPSEPYRVLLQRALIPKPVDITLTQYRDGTIFLTEVRFLRNERLETFRYDPRY